MSEYWCDDAGEVMFCDGDAEVNAPNHNQIVQITAAAHVEQSLLRHRLAGTSTAFMRAVEAAIDAVGVDPGVGGGLWDRDLFVEVLNTRLDEAHRAGLVSDAVVDDPYEHLREVLSSDDEDPDLVKMLTYDPSNSSSFDPRDFAIDRWNWIRIADCVSQLRRLTPGTLKRLANAYWEIDPTEACHQAYDLAVLDPGGIRDVYRGVTFVELTAGDVQAVRARNQSLATG